MTQDKEDFQFLRSLIILIKNFDRFKPWRDETFSGKMKYKLDNGKKYEVYREFWDCDKIEKAYLALEPYFSDKKEQYKVAQSIKKALKMIEYKLCNSYYFP